MTCQQCGRTPRDDADTLAWGTSVERGQVQHLCPECARTHARSIEAKLESEYWS